MHLFNSSIRIYDNYSDELTFKTDPTDNLTLNNTLKIAFT